MEIIVCIIACLICFLALVIWSYIDLYFKIKKFNKKYGGSLSFKKSNYRNMNKQYLEWYLSMFAYDEVLEDSYYHKNY